RQGARVLLPRGGSPLGPAPAAPRDVAPAQRPARARRDGARLSAVQLDREGRVALHRPRAARRGAALLRRRAPHHRAQRQPSGAGRRPPAAARRRAGEDRPRSLPHAGVLATHGSRPLRRHRPRKRHRGDAVGQCVRAPGPADRPRRHRRHGAQEAGGLLLMPALAEAFAESPAERLGAPAPSTRLLRSEPAPESAPEIGPEIAPGIAGRIAPQTAPQVAPGRVAVAAGSLHVLTCGSVDDGKSTLIGRMLWDAGALTTDQRAAIERGARTAAGTPDFSRLVDGLAAEREQGITIDIAWRYFDTQMRRLVIIDSPGHEQYTRNM